MSTLSDILSRVRYRVQDPDAVELTDTKGIAFANAILEEIHQHLTNIESNLVYGETTVTLAEDTAEYDLGVSHYGILDQGVWFKGSLFTLEWMVGTDFVDVNLDPTATGAPRYYYLTTDNQIAFHPIPDADEAGEEVTVLYWKQEPQLTSVSNTVPWYGIFDRVLDRWITMDFRDSQDANVSHDAVMLQNFWAHAMQAVYSRGVRPWKRSNDMSSAEGV